MELEKITGFPSNTINESMRFEEDLGLISINLVEMYAHLIDVFPEYEEVDMSKAVSVQTLGEMLNMLTLDKRLSLSNITYYLCGRV